MIERGAEQSSGEVPAAGADPAMPTAAFVPTDPGAAASTAPRVPGSADERFQRFPTGMMDLPTGAPVAEADSNLSGPRPWTGEPVTVPVRPRGIAGWGLAFSIVGLLASFVVGWAFPVSVVGLLTGMMALRRPFENRSAAVWALVLGITGLVYSIGWLVFAATSADLFG